MGVAELTVACPAGTPVDPPGEGPSCVCGVIERENTHGAFIGDHVDALVSGLREPTTLAAYCMNADGYRICPVWQANQGRLAKGAKTISATDTNYGDVGNRD
jgi:hypothetical protein